MNVLISTKPFVICLEAVLVSVMVRTVVSLSAAIPHGTSTKRADYGGRLLWHINCHKVQAVLLVLQQSVAAAWLACVGPHWQRCSCLVHQLVGLSTINIACHNLSASSSSGFRHSASCCVLSKFWGSSNVQPMCSHDSPRSLENGDSIPRQSGCYGVDLG